MVIYGGRGGVMDRWHRSLGVLGEGGAGGGVGVQKSHGGILLDSGTDGGLSRERSGLEDVAFRAGDGDGAAWLGGMLFNRLLRRWGRGGGVEVLHWQVEVKERGWVFRGVFRRVE